MRLRASLPCALVACVLTVSASSAAAPERVQCRTTNGQVGEQAREVVIDLPRLPGTTVDKDCTQALREAGVFAAVAVLGEDERGREALLNEPNGAEQFVAALSRGRASTVAREPIALLGREETLFRMRGDALRVKDAEVLTARVKVPGHNVSFLAVYPAAQSSRYRAQMKRLFQQARISLEGVGPLSAARAPQAKADALSECRTTNGEEGALRREVIVRAPRIPGASVTPACSQLVGGSSPSLAVFVHAGLAGGTGPARMLEAPDAHEQIVQQQSRGRAKRVGSEKLTLAGRKTSLFRYRADLSAASSELKDAEVLVAILKLGDHNVLMMASYPTADAARRREALRRHLERVQVEIEPSRSSAAQVD